MFVIQLESEGNKPKNNVDHNLMSLSKIKFSFVVCLGKSHLRVKSQIPYVETSKHKSVNYL